MEWSMNVIPEIGAYLHIDYTVHGISIRSDSADTTMAQSRIEAVDVASSNWR